MRREEGTNRIDPVADFCRFNAAANVEPSVKADFCCSCRLTSRPRQQLDRRSDLARCGDKGKAAGNAGDLTVSAGGNLIAKESGNVIRDRQACVLMVGGNLIDESTCGMTVVIARGSN